MTGGTTAVVIGTGIEEAEGIGVIVIVIATKGLSTRRKRSSKLAEDQRKVIEVTTGVIREVLPGVVSWSVDVVMILPRPKKLNAISRPAEEPMFDDGKKRIVAHLAVLDHTVAVDMTMILMMIFLERGKRDVSHAPSTIDSLLT